ncbi:site-specific integrase [Acidithiobacillus sp. MC6.1]|nr:site-specific integrase [Acidithiobacillus sp. MC6.1]
MATISPRYDDQNVRIGWQARVRKRGYPVQTKTFRTKADAERWARSIENEMDRGVFVQRTEAENTTLADLLDRYQKEVTSAKRGAAQESSHIKVIRQHPIAQRFVASIFPKDLAQYRDDRLKVVSPSTVNREFNILSHVFTVAQQDWGIPFPVGNPVQGTRRPKVDDKRDRRLVGDEEKRLLDAAQVAEREDGSMPIAHIIQFALETAMRRGELAAMLWQHIDVKAKALLIPESKTGDSRRIPLSSRALAVLDAKPRHKSGYVWGNIHQASISRAFARACKRAGIEDLRFHDLRHEATSRLFEKGLNPLQVAAITGHETLQMLKRYTHLRAEDLAKLLG